MSRLFLKKTGQEVFRLDKQIGDWVQVLRPLLPHEGRNGKSKGEILNVRASSITTAVAST